MKNKRAAKLAVLLAASMCLAACGNGTTSAGTNDSQISASADVTGTVSNLDVTPTAEPTQEPEAGPLKTDGYTVTYAEGVEIGTYAYAETLTTRAVSAVTVTDGAFISWRKMPGDDNDTCFLLKRNGKEVYNGGKTCYKDASGKGGDTYELSVMKGKDVLSTEKIVCASKDYYELTLVRPEMQRMPNYKYAQYSANDFSTGDLDGDGELELIVKWYPDNAQDNSKDGYTGTTILDAYDIDYTTMTASLMWRIDLGINIRSGAHYTQFQVWDYDGDGNAELICKTADGSTTYDADLNETGHVGELSMTGLDTSKRGKPETYDFRQFDGRLGRIVLGQEYLTAFDGPTGEIIDTVKYVPERGPWDEAKKRYDTSMWGVDANGKGVEKNDGYANRADRFLAGTAYLDDGSACAIMCRGYYGRSCITAWKLINDKLVMKWAFDAAADGQYAAQGNHQLSINDVDGDGYDEIIYGAMCVDNDGNVMYSTGLGHGDAMHISDWNNDGRLEVFSVHEHTDAEYSVELHDAATGEILWGVGLGKDVGRGVAADIDPEHDGAEMWSASRNGTYDCNGNLLYDEKPSVNFSLYWDGDLSMELFDSNNSEDLVPQIQKWDYKEHTLNVLTEASGCQANNGTKANACLIADILGDWREEVIVREVEDPCKIRIYTTGIETEYSFDCLLTNTTYREGVAWQNTAYNQPANLPYLLKEN